MPSDKTDTNASDVQSRYARMFADDRQNIEAEQQSVRTQIRDLQARLEQLDRDHAWVSGMLSTAPETESPQEESGAAAETAPAVPVQRTQEEKPAAEGGAAAKKTATPGAAPGRKPAKAAGKKTAAKKTAKAVSKKTTATRAPADKAPAKKATSKRATPAKAAAPRTAGTKQSDQQPRVADLIRTVLSRRSEPMLFKEIKTEVDALLKQADPDRTVSEQGVRKALKQLVAHEKVLQSKKQGSDFFSTADGAQAAPDEKGKGAEKDSAA